MDEGAYIAAVLRDRAALLDDIEYMKGGMVYVETGADTVALAVARKAARILARAESLYHDDTTSIYSIELQSGCVRAACWEDTLARYVFEVSLDSDGVLPALSVTRRKLETPVTAEEHKRQETPTTSPNGRQPAHLTDQAPGTTISYSIERAAQESRRITPTSTAAVLASSTATTRHHYLHPTNRVFTRSSQL